VSVIATIRRANQPGPPEDSIRLRVACTGAVLVAIAACAALGEVPTATAWAAGGLVAAGMVFSYVTRARPPGWVKVLVALAAVAALVWFFDQVSTRPVTDITTVEDPLTGLFVYIQVVHSFHVPARRDLMFSLGASAALMAVGAAQAIDLRYAPYALAWVAFVLWGLLESWTAASRGGRTSWAGLGAALIGVTVSAAVAFLLLPAPTVGVRINFLARAGSGGAVPLPGALAGDGSKPSELARAGSPAGPTRVGGYLGFANSLDTALRGRLSHRVVMRVRAERPSYWVGETFDTWDGQSWTATDDPSRRISQGSPFVLPASVSGTSASQTDLQTFYIASSTADLVFHAESAYELWFPTSSVFYSEDGTIVSPIGLGRGAIYTVQSVVNGPTAAQLRVATRGPALPPAEEQQYTRLPHAYPQAQALAESVTANAGTTYDRVQALIAWMGAHTRYSTDIPPLTAGSDTVDEFLFGNRVGFCEQISTSLAVMLRSLGIPVREVVGYVPGPYNPVTDLYDVQADDAHAWVQVWIPGYGWQSFDPTASVPLSNPAPGAAAVRDLGRVLHRVPLLPVTIILLACGTLVAGVRWRRTRPTTWAEQVAHRVERTGRRAGRRRRPSETLTEYATALDGLTGDGSTVWRDLADEVERSVYGDREPSADGRRALVRSAGHIRIDRGRARRVASGVP
jgi:transglutaminase-like putative cysteine protease